MGVGVPRTPEIFQVPNSPGLGVSTKAGVGLEPLTCRDPSAFALLPLLLEEQRDDSVIKMILFVQIEGDSFCRVIVFLINASESTVATLDEKHGRDGNPSGITFEMEFSESLSEEMFELKL